MATTPQLGITGGRPAPAPTTAPAASKEIPPEAEQVTEPQVRNVLPGVKVMLIGDSGTGKTHSLRTLIDQGLEVFGLFTESGMDVVADIPSSKLKWKYVSPSSASWKALLDSGNKINSMAYETLAKLPHVNRGEHKEFLTVIGALDNFIDDRTGECFGSVQHFGPDRVLWLDSFSGLSDMAMNLIAGSKPIKHQGDYGVSMDNLYNIFAKLCNDLFCHVVIVCHPSRERDEVTSQSLITVSTIGNKLAPKLPQLCTDVIHTKRVESKFYWSTTTPNMTLKARNLPWADNMAPSFAPIITSWRRKAEQARA